MSAARSSVPEAHLIPCIASVKDGADVYDRGLAAELRDVERRFPNLIKITEPMMYKGDGTDRVPYFGAIATPAGKRAIRAAKKRGDA
jgi:hypothetical protein